MESGSENASDQPVGQVQEELRTAGEGTQEPLIVPDVIFSQPAAVSSSL